MRTYECCPFSPFRDRAREPDRDKHGGFIVRPAGSEDSSATKLF